MIRANLIIVFHPDEDKILMCHRQKEPYLGLYNFVGGKLENNETNIQAAYRELNEETGIEYPDIDLTPLFTTMYHQNEFELQVYFGKLKKNVTLTQEINPLVWMTLDEDFSDVNKFAGHGNIKHMIAMILDGHVLIERE